MEPGQSSASLLQRTDMAWPKRKTRKIVIDEEEWLWHFSGHCNQCSEAVVRVGKANGRYFLALDTSTSDFSFAPSHIASSIRWAVAQGWTAEKGPNRSLTALASAFKWLPMESNTR